MKVSGEAFPGSEHQGAPSVAADETPISIDSFQGGTHQLGWRDETGARLELVGQPQTNISFPALSPDAQWVAVQGQDGGNYDIWIHDLARSIKTRLTFDPAYNGRPKWSPSGGEIVFHSDRDAAGGAIFKRAADGTGDPELLVGSAERNYPGGWSSDGKHFVFSRRSEQTSFDLLYLERKPAGDAYDEHVFLQTEFAEQTARVSRDGRFIAYMSNEAGTQFNIYVRSFPEGGGKHRISPRGGRQVTWSRDGKTLFYGEGETLIAVPVSTRKGFSAGAPRPLFEHSGFGSFSGANYDVSPDGKRFLVIEAAGEQEDKPPSIRVVENWIEEHRKR